MAHVFLELEEYKNITSYATKCTLELQVFNVNYSFMRNPSIIMACECVYVYFMTYS